MIGVGGRTPWVGVLCSVAVDAIELGVTSVADLMVFALAFWTGTLVVEVCVLLWCRARLAGGGHRTGLATLLFALIGCGAIPVIGVHAGCSYSAQRSVAAAIEGADLAAVVDEVDIGARRLQRELNAPDDRAVIDLSDARRRVQARAADAGDGVGGALERAWWHAVGLALDKVGPHATWGVLYAAARAEAKDQLHEELFGYADDVRKSARRTLWLFVALLALGNGLAMFVFARAAARPPARAAGSGE